MSHALAHNKEEDPMSLKAKLDAYRENFEKTVPSEIVSVLHRATAELVASGKADQAKKVGDRAPSFTLPDQDEREVSSDRLLQEGPLVITFYRGVWCPFCNLDLQALGSVAGAIRELPGNLVAISPQTPANSRKAQRTHSLAFPILSDHGGLVAEAFGLRFRMPDDLIASYRSLGVDLSQFNGEPSWTLPMPARFVVDQEGWIVYAEVNPRLHAAPRA